MIIIIISLRLAVTVSSRIPRNPHHDLSLLSPPQCWNNSQSRGRESGNFRALQTNQHPDIQCCSQEAPCHFQEILSNLQQDSNQVNTMKYSRHIVHIEGQKLNLPIPMTQLIQTLIPLIQRTEQITQNIYQNFLKIQVIPTLIRPFIQASLPIPRLTPP